MSFLVPDRPPPQQQAPLPTEDPAVTAERERQKQRAEEDKIRATQDQLKLETQQRSGNAGIASLVGVLGSSGRRGKTSLLGW